MDELKVVAPAFVEMAHHIVWCSAATIDQSGRPRSRVLHPVWDWDGTSLRGVIATSPLSPKRADLDAHPFISLNYWANSHDTCLAECSAAWKLDDESRAEGWDRIRNAPAPVGYDPSIIPGWDSPTALAFGILEVVPWRLRVMPGSYMVAREGVLLTWSSSASPRTDR
jgi:hypothetical protein